MFEKILTAIDNSALGNQVFNQALTLARTFNAQLLLLHVLSDEEVGYPDVRNLADHLDRWEASKQTGVQMLENHLRTAIAAGVRTSIAQTPGSSGKTICETARNWGADVIIVGHRGLSGVKELMQGSVSNYLVHHAPCAVLTILAQADPAWQNILVAIDGSDIARQAFDQALALAQTTGAKLHLLHVLSVEDKGSPSIFSLRDPDFERKWEVFAKPSLDMLRSHQEMAQAAGVETEIHQKLGSNPGRVICDLAQGLQFDLIVVGRRGLSGLAEMLMGSVSNYVTHYAPCSVLTMQGDRLSPSTPADNQLATQTH
jgi:nucleotide-binding universal stress UspA family protein